jgi:hypothetical protein
MIVNSIVLFYDGSCRRIPITLNVKNLQENETRAKEIFKDQVDKYYCNCGERALAVIVKSVIEN